MAYRPRGAVVGSICREAWKKAQADISVYAESFPRISRRKTMFEVSDHRDMYAAAHLPKCIRQGGTEMPEKLPPMFPANSEHDK